MFEFDPHQPYYGSGAVRFSFMTNRLRDPIYMSIMVLLSLLWLWFSPKYMWYSMERRLKKFVDEGDTGELYSLKIINVDAEGIRETSAKSTASYQWQAVTKIAEGETAIYLSVSSVQALIVQNRLFDSLEERQNFIEYCKEMTA